MMVTAAVAWKIPEPLAERKNLGAVSPHLPKMILALLLPKLLWLCFSKNIEPCVSFNLGNSIS